VTIEAALLVAGGSLALLVAAEILFSVRERRRGRFRRWLEAAGAAGLTDLEESSALGQPILRGRAESLEVTIRPYDVGRHATGLHVSVKGCAELGLRPETMGTALQKTLTRRDAETGDAAFDRAVYVTGAPDLALAVLDVETRRSVRSLLESGVGPDGDTGMVLAGGVLEGFFPRGADLTPERLARVLAPILAGAKRLLPPASIADRLADNLGREPEPSVRIRCVRLLARHAVSDAVVREQLQRSAAEDPADEVRLEAAVALGDHGRAQILDLAGQTWISDAVGARAVRLAGRELPTERMLETLAHALRTRRSETARACLELAQERGGADLVKPLARVASFEPGALAAAACRALGACGSAAEAPLLAALKRAPIEVRTAAAEALGRVGSAASVLPLKEAAAEDGPTLARAVRQAVAEIQERLAGASPGQLSLADGTSGQLSLADDEGGRVSLADQPGPAKPVEEAQRRRSAHPPAPPAAGDAKGRT
jgi:hypothetical protein